MRSEELTFRGAQGDLLHARLEQPIGATIGYAIFAHCFTCGKDSIAASRIARSLAERDIATLRFDFTGLGNSDGDFANTSFTTNVEDLQAAIDHMSSVYEPPRLLLGHSLGGAAVLSLARRSDLDCAVVTLGAPYDPDHVGHLFSQAHDEIRSKGVAEVLLGGRKIRIGKSFLDDLARGGDTVEQLRKPLLVMHAPLDKIVGIANAEKIFRSAHHPKSFVSLDSADHLLVRREDAEYAAEVIAAWSSRYMPRVNKAESRVNNNSSLNNNSPHDSPLASGAVEVSESLRSGLEQTIISGRHMLIADEPESLGGLDRGPTPFDYVLSALGACTTITLRMYAKRSEIALRRASVRLSFAAPNSEGKRVLHRSIRLEGDLSDQQRSRLIEIAERCPVHRAYSIGFSVETSESK